MTRYAAAYLRRSVVSEGRPGDASEAAQTEAVQRMCGPNVVIFKDWGVSGTKTARPDYQRLRSEIAAGNVESICAYSLSRLGRSTTELLSLVELCRVHNVTLRTDRENINTSSAMGKLLFTFMAALAAFEADVSSERTKAGLDAKRAKGHDLRRPALGFKAETDAKGLRILVTDGSANPVVAAYREAKTFEGAAKLLTERKTPTQREVIKAKHAEEKGETYVPKTKVWSPTVVRRTVARHAPELLPPAQPSRRLTRHGKGLYGQLFKCPDCDGALTPSIANRQLYCSRARRLPHTKSVLAFSKVRPFMEAESAKYQPEGIVIRGGTSDTERLALIERKRRVGEVYESGGMTPEVWKKKVADIDTKLAQLTSSDRAIASIEPNPKGIDWSLSDDEVGDQLRLIWDRVELGPDWLPKTVHWRVPIWLYDSATRDAYIAEQDAAVEAAQKAGG